MFNEISQKLFYPNSYAERSPIVELSYDRPLICWNDYPEIPVPVKENPTFSVGFDYVFNSLDQ